MPEQVMPPDQSVDGTPDQSTPPMPTDGTTDPSQATTQISYCPLLDIYHYWRADGTDYLFDTHALLTTVETYLREGKERLAEFMGQLTSWARQFPHKLVTIHPDGRFEVRNLKQHKLEGEGEEGVAAASNVDGEVTNPSIDGDKPKS